MAGPRLRGNVWQLQDRVPVDIAERHRGATITVTVAGEVNVVTVGTQVKLSLKTSDKKAAVERYRDVSAQLAEAYTKLRQAVANGPTRLSVRQCDEIARDYFIFWKDQYRDGPSDPDPLEEGSEAAFDEGATFTGRERLHGMWADDLLQKRGLIADPESRERLLLAMHRAYLDAFRRIVDAGRGDWRGMQGGEERFPEPVKVQPKPALTLADVRDAWVRDRERQGKPPKTISMFRTRFGSLIEYLGGDDQKDANSVTPEDVEGWIDWMETRPSDKTGKPLDRTTIADGYLTMVKAGFQHSRRKLTSWPFDGVKFVAGRKPKQRPPGFSEAEAEAILRAATVGKGISPSTGDHVRRAIRWIPWICAYTGARVGEIAQLRMVDFMEEGGIKFIRITPEAGSVKTDEFRDVPLHPHLIEQGLWEVVQATNRERPFWSARMTTEVSVANRVREWFREETGITDPRLQPNHAWRHRFATLARRDTPEQVWMSITGHTDDRAAAGYGEVDLQTKLAAILRLPRVNVDDPAKPPPSA
jgi:integrase